MSRKPNRDHPLAVRRHELGITQNDLERLTRRTGDPISITTISKIERGGSCRRRTQRRLLAAVGLLECDRTDLFPTVEGQAEARHG